MFDLSKVEGIYLFSGYTDMRSGIFALSSIVSNLLKEEEMLNKVFIFCGKDRRNIKVLQIDYDGYWLYQKRLYTGKFKWPKKKEDMETILIDKRQLMWLLDGLSIVQSSAHKNMFNITE